MKRMLRIFLLSKNKHIKLQFLKPALTIIAIALCFGPVMAQKPVPAAKTKAPLQRCGTMEALQQQMQTDPELRARLEQNESEFQQWLINNGNNNQAARPNSPTALPGPVTIPVVVHVVLPNPWLISDEQIEYFINRLNLDFSGLNADSANCANGNFCGTRGHSLLRFSLARRDPAGNFTTGIVRKVGTTLIIQGNPQPIKNSATASGGSTGWDHTKYYNFYVGASDSTSPTGELLGIAPTIGPGGAPGTTNADGVCVNYRVFGPSCFTYDQYNLSRTAVHEVGHNFGLYHIWGDGQTCNDFVDFRQLASAGCSLPAALLGANDDTPNQSGPTSGGCPTTTTNNGCPTSTPRMYQNYMDYTDDACYSMFTNGQAKRMEHVLEFCRAGGYLTTQGAQYPNLFPLDAMVNSVVSPGGAEVIFGSNCDIQRFSYPTQKCQGTFVPKLRITNAGNTTLTSVTVTTSINNANLVTQTIPVNIPFGKWQVVTLSPQTAVGGLNVLRFALSAPNGGADGNPRNDTMSYSFRVATPLTLPYVENFSGAFPPANSEVVNADGPPDPGNGTGITWERSARTGRPGPNSMWINLYNYFTVGARDLYKLAPINVAQLDSVSVSFYYAYLQYFGNDVPAPLIDSLKLVYSTDCGVTWKPTSFVKGGAELATTDTTSGFNFIPTNPALWKKETIVLKDFCADNISNIQLAFESYNDFGNNIFIDSINIVGPNSVAINAAVLDIVQPSATYCDANLEPVALIGNAGTDTLRSVTVNYSIDNGAVSSFNWTGTLARCENVSIPLAAASVSYAPHSIRVFTTNPNGVADQGPANDQLTRDFTVYNTFATPVREDFNATTFPPANWGVINANGGGTTWERRLPVATDASQGAMLMNNPNTANRGNSVDYFISPVIANSSTFDSVFVDFDMAYRPGANYPGSTVLPLDTLDLMATTDCGATFTTVWKKWGDALQTIKDPNYAWVSPYVPLSGEWQKQRAYLSPFVGASNFQLYFAMKGNRQNNLWVDNINISSQKLPQRLKDQGYLIYPNPFNGTFLIHHSAVEPPVDLQAVLVYNSAGQMVWNKDYNGNANRQITVNLRNVASGVYILKMIYTNKTVIERIVKAQ